MKIAYLTYEYPPDTAFGGVGTYCFQASNLLAQMGNEVHVFTATLKESFILTDTVNLTIHRLQSMDPQRFYVEIVDKFLEVHSEMGFDMIECSEYLNEALIVKQVTPEVPLVVKLHTPMYLIGELNSTPLTIWRKMRYILGLVRRFKFPNFPWVYDKSRDTNYQVACLADVIHSPSISLKSIVERKWNILPEKIKVVPYPYTINENLLKIPIRTNNRAISYIGRIENRKGVFNFAKSLPPVFERFPDVVVQFVGANTLSPFGGGKDAISYIKEDILANYETRISFLQLEYKDIHKAFSSTDVCVFPSLWENFPNVCLEAMAAGRCIIASENGGMNDMLKDCDGGILVNPARVDELTSALISVLSNENERWRLGENARSKLVHAYSSEVIGRLMQEEYISVVNRTKRSFKI